MLKTFLMWLVALAFLSFLPPAKAADLSYKAERQITAASHNWSGFYAGVHGGWANSYDDASIAGTDVVGGFAVATGAVPGVLKTEPNGWLLGGHAGYNWQVSSLVFGVEGTIAWTDVDGSASQNLTLAPLGLPIGLSTSSNTGLDWLATAEARVGFTLTDRFLVFAKGGAAFGKVSSDTTVSLAAPAPFGVTAAGSYSDTKTGWTVGGGAEYAIAPNWTVRADYSFIDLGSADYAFGATVPIGPGVPASFTAHQDFTYHLVKVGTSLKF